MMQLPDVLLNNMDMWDYEDGVPTANETATDEVREAVEEYAEMEADAEEEEEEGAIISI